MFSGTTFTNYSGNVLGGHQKIDRSAYSILNKTVDISLFPSIKNIIQFEGRNGPDGIKAKSPGKDEPWHYYDPYDDHDHNIIDIMEHHYEELVEALREGNREKSAFEAAWLAHAVVDGLTPAHHYPYEEELERLRGGQGLESRDSVIKKLLIPRDNQADAIKKNWEMWGSKGLLSTHALFEWGVALLIAPLHLGRKPLSKHACKQAVENGVATTFKLAAREIADQDIFHAYYRYGWNQKMVKVVKGYLAPKIVESLAIIWYLALDEAKSGESRF